jgi:hypothetical protein
LTGERDGNDTANRRAPIGQNLSHRARHQGSDGRESPELEREHGVASGRFVEDGGADAAEGRAMVVAAPAGALSIERHPADVAAGAVGGRHICLTAVADEGPEGVAGDAAGREDEVERTVPNAEKRWLS